MLTRAFWSLLHSAHSCCTKVSRCLARSAPFWGRTRWASSGPQYGSWTQGWSGACQPAGPALKIAGPRVRPSGVLHRRTPHDQQVQICGSANFKVIRMILLEWSPNACSKIGDFQALFRGEGVQTSLPNRSRNATDWLLGEQEDGRPQPNYCILLPFLWDAPVQPKSCPNILRGTIRPFTPMMTSFTSTSQSGMPQATAIRFHSSINPPWKMRCTRPAEPQPTPSTTSVLRPKRSSGESL